MEISVSEKFANMKPSATREILKATSDPALLHLQAALPPLTLFPVRR